MARTASKNASLGEVVSPTVFREGGYRFFFFSREESRIHIHITCADGEAKFWLDPVVALATSHGLPRQVLRELQKIVEDKDDELRSAWQRHFGQS